MPDQSKTVDLAEVKRLLTMSADQLHKLGLDELREGAGLLLAVSDLCKARGRSLHKFADGRQAIGVTD